mgnify:CR=1 FL=1
MPHRVHPRRQLTANSDETTLRLGSLKCLNTFMTKLPILLRVETIQGAHDAASWPS